MCGIVGVIELDGRAASTHQLDAAAAVLEHRGPDDRGSYADGPVAFLHRRLSIIDLAGSPQPMTSASGRYTVTFNGEIFNYRDLRARYDYPWRTNGDTEVLLAGFEQRGPDAVTDLDGQFAFGMWDRVERVLWLGRDRVGVLPLFWCRIGDRLAFASEIKALLALPWVPTELASEQLDAFLAHRSVPAPDTLFKGIHKLRAGHLLRVDASGTLSEQPYWQLPSVDETLEVTAAQAVTLVDGALNRAVERSMVADVAVGAYLSGGLDSSLICALAARRVGAGRLETFSAGFGDNRHDELPYAEVVSQHLQTRHHPVLVTAEEFEQQWQRLSWFRDAPLSEPADVAVAALAKAASQSVKVVLSGEGSDELFAGYPKYRYTRALEAACAIPSAIRQPLLRGVDRALPERGRRLQVALRVAAEPSGTERLRAWFAPFTRDERSRLLGRPSTPIVSPDSVRWTGDPIRRLLVHDAGAWLSDNLLERGDRMTMSSSVELRPPFLDRELVELAFRLPSRVKVHRGQTKWVVKEVARQYLPESIVTRRKVGFTVPLDAWFRRGLRDLAADLLGPQSFAREVFEPKEIDRILHEHLTGRVRREIQLWTLLSLEMWHRAFFSDHPGSAPPENVADLRRSVKETENFG